MGIILVGDWTVNLLPGSGVFDKGRSCILSRFPVYYPRGPSLGVVGISGNLAEKMTPGS